MDKYELSIAFNEAKDKLDLKRTAEYYGMRFDRYGKALCPYHADHHPSFSVKGKRFKCFSCNASGDVFDLCGKILGISKSFDILSRLNKDFSLGLNLDKKPTAEEHKKALVEKAAYEKYNAINTQFEEWINNAQKALSKHIRQMRYDAYEYAPTSPDIEPDQRYIYSMQNLSYAVYVWECLVYGDEKERQSVYINCRTYIRHIIKKVSDEP